MVPAVIRNTTRTKSSTMNTGSTQRRSLLQTVGLLSIAVVLFSIHWAWTSTPKKDSPGRQDDPFASIRHTKAECQVTSVFPFKVGCPNKCERALSVDEPMYRMALTWYFADLSKGKGYEYEKGVNYECPDELVDNFRTSAKTMKTVLTKTPGLHFNAQKQIHLNLAYLCCLRKNETNWAREIMYEWVLANHPFDFTVKFDTIECWRERHNSVTNIIYVDDASQRVMLKMNQDLERVLRAKGIPTEVPRTLQMPFHITLFGVFRGKGDSLAPKYDIAPDMPEIYKQISNLSKTVGDQWAGKKHVTIQHAPHFTAEGKLHAGKE